MCGLKLKADADWQRRERSQEINAGQTDYKLDYNTKTTIT
jgi:hypothetical protein